MGIFDKIGKKKVATETTRLEQNTNQSMFIDERINQVKTKEDTEYFRFLKDLFATYFISNSSTQSKITSLAELLRSYYKVDYLTLFLIDEKTEKLQISSTNVNTEHINNIEIVVSKLLSEGIEDTKILVSSDDQALRYKAARSRGVKMAMVTLIKDEYANTKGVLFLENVGADMVQNLDMDLISKIYSVTQSVVLRILENERVLSLISKDQLTGIYNRRYIDITLSEQFELFNGTKQQMALCLFDIDNFKKFNDTYGHHVGDEVLQQVAEYVESKIKNIGWVARYGGEEFLLYFSRMDYLEVEKLIEEIREGIATLDILDDTLTDKVRVTSSFGCIYIENTNWVYDYKEALMMADSNLYKSKDNGRNCLTISSVKRY